MFLSRNRRSTAILAVLAILTVPVAGCSTHSADSYDRDEMGQAISVEHGTVVSVRQVKVEGTESGVGAATGAAVGGIGGYQIGGNRAVNVVGAIGGAVIGGLIGLAAEKGLTSDTAEEVVVQEDGGATRAYIQKMDDPNALEPGDRVLIMRGAKTRVVKDPSGTPAPALAPSTGTAGATHTASMAGSTEATSMAPAASVIDGRAQDQ